MDSNLIFVNKIAVHNLAGFDLFFWISYIARGGGEGFTKNNSGSYPIGQTRTFDLSAGDPPIPIGTQVWPTVKADGGVQKDGNTGGKALIYAADGGTATFTVKGETLTYSVNLDQ